MSVVAPVAEAELRVVARGGAPRDSEFDQVALGAITELATADGVEQGIAKVVGFLRRRFHAGRIEWLSTDEDGSLRLVAADGRLHGRSAEHRLGQDDVIVTVGAESADRIVSVLAPLEPVLRQMRSEELLSALAMRLARRNAALEDFAALLAHDLKAPLLDALAADDPSNSIERALDLVDSLLDTARDEAMERTFSSPARCLDEVIRELRVSGVAITTELSSAFPLPAKPLLVLLRNMLRNALAAGATAIHVSAGRSPDAWTLVVEDDGVGLADTDGYVSGSGLGLELSRRLVGRFGGALELTPRTRRGTRATLVLAEAA